MLMMVGQRSVVSGQWSVVNHNPATIHYRMMPMTDDLQEKIDAGKVALGGCCLSFNDPKWKCSDCGVDIYRKE